jgi:hypothetical protein
LKRVIIVLLTCLVIDSIAQAEQGHGRNQSSRWMFAGHKKWLKCQSDDQCTIILTPHCRFMLAVNKNYSDEASKFAAEKDECTAVPVYPNGTVTKCKNNECVLVFPNRKNDTVPSN